MDTKKLIAELRRDEGCILHAYKCSAGFWTIGIGRMIDRRRGGGITEEEAMYLLENDIGKAITQLRRHLPWFDDLSDARQRALCNMAFQMGIEGLLDFKNTLDLMRRGFFQEAAINARKSKWYRQTPERAERVIEMIREG